MNARDLLRLVREQVGAIAWERMNGSQQCYAMRAALCAEMLLANEHVSYWREVHAEAVRIIDAAQWGDHK